MADSHHLYEELVTRYKEYSVLSSVHGLLHWDTQVIMSPKGSDRRAEQMAVLSGISHDKITSPRLGELIEKIGAIPNGLTPEQKANVREIHRDYKLATKIPKDLVEEMSRAKSHAHDAWVSAREKSDFGAFAPHLEKLVALSRKMAECIGYAETPYDALLDQYEPDSTASMFTKLFDEVKATTIPLLQKVLASPVKAKMSILEREFPPDLQKKVGAEVMHTLGFDAEAGRLDTSVHPFCSGGKGDIRITTRYNPRAPQQALYGVIHETGHALYEQEVDPDHLYTPLSEALSMGLHESQSRMWENFVGRSRHFWIHFFPKFKAVFPQQTADVSIDDLVLAVNHVARSYVRVEADELTYDLHIILRFELERDLFSGALSVSDLPTAWNTKFENYLGIKPPDNGKNGVLQDVHWSEAYFGYFPSYSLGNMVAGQLWATMRKEMPQMDAQIEKGQFGDILNWLRTKVHRQGRRFSRDELLTQATGKPLSTSDYRDYLTAKFTQLYKL